MKSIQYIIQMLIKGFIVAIILFFVFLSIKYFFGTMIVWNNQMAKELLYYGIYGVVLTFINAGYFDILNYKIQWDKYPNLQKYRLVIGFLGSVLFTLLGIFFIRLFIVLVLENKSYEFFITNEKIGHYYFSLLVTLIVSLVFHVIYFYKQHQEKKIAEQKIIATTATAKFESLKNQIDPHFLFNSLNVLSSLIEENPENAQNFTTALSKIYRYVLDQKDKELVPLEEELNFAETYIKLLKMRFENSIQFSKPTLDENFEGKVIPLGLQLILENCIKHNVMSEQNPLKIDITIQDNYLVVNNNLQKKEHVSVRKGVGLQNIISRYKLLTNKTVIIESNESYFKIKIPILTKLISTMQPQTNQSESYQRALKKVTELKEFYGNLISYAIVIPFLIYINYITYWEFKWFLFPLFGWGLGLCIHAFQAFGIGNNWEEKKIKELMEQDTKQKWS